MKPGSLDTLAGNGDARAMRYDGGKGACFAQLINLIPPHKRYIETHLGGGAVMRNKLPAPEQYGIERDARVVAHWRELLGHVPCHVVHGDATALLPQLPLDSDTVIYADPPYHPDTRRRVRVYRHDYSVGDHEALLSCLTRLPCKVLISGYTSPLYEERLTGWNKHTFMARTRVEMREECVWFNFPRPTSLHDDRYLGDGFRQREQVRRRQERLRRRLKGLTATERASLHAWLTDLVESEASA